MKGNKKDLNIICLHSIATKLLESEEKGKKNKNPNVMRKKLRLKLIK